MMNMSTWESQTSQVKNKWTKVRSSWYLNSSQAVGKWWHRGNLPSRAECSCHGCCSSTASIQRFRQPGTIRIICLGVWFNSILWIQLPSTKLLKKIAAIIISKEWMAQTPKEIAGKNSVKSPLTLKPSCVGMPLFTYKGSSTTGLKS